MSAPLDGPAETGGELGSPGARISSNGRRWPPQPTDVEATERVRREFGLNDLLSRMPVGLL